MTDANIESQVNMVREIFFEKAHTLLQDQRFFDSLNERITQAIDAKLESLDITMEKKNELREYILNSPEEGLLANEERKQQFIDFLTGDKEQLRSYFGEFINELLSGTDDQMIEHLTHLFYAIAIEPDAINGIYSKMNMGNMKAVGSRSIQGCKVTGCLDGLIDGSKSSSMEINAVNNAVNNATGSSGSTIKGGTGIAENYEKFPLVMGWDGTTGITLSGTESGGCKNNMDFASSRELCDNSPECDGFFAYARNDSDRVCFKTNVDTSNIANSASPDWINSANAPNSAFFVKKDRVNSNNPPEPFSNIEEVHVNKGIKEDDNGFGNIMTTLLFVILVYYLCKKLKLF